MTLQLSKIYNQFKRNTTGAFIPEIDGLRFIAISTVVILHLQHLYLERITYDLNYTVAGEFIRGVVKKWFIGVPLFFVISGFILCLPFANHILNKTKKVSLKKYYWKRVTRLEPPYFLVLISVFVMKILLDQYTFSELLPNLLSSLVYIHNIVFDSMSKITPIAWSLEIEVQFYLLAPFIARIFYLNKNIRRVSFLFLMILMPILQEQYDISKLNIFGNLQYFLAGFLLADLYLTKDKINISKNLGIVLGTVLLLSLLFTNVHNSVGRVAYPLLIFGFYYLVLFTDFWKKIFSNKILSSIGGMCYTIYLLHFAIISFIGEATFKIQVGDNFLLNFLVQQLVVLPILLIICSIFFLLIEKPCMDKNWPQKAISYIKNFSFTSKN